MWRAEPILLSVLPNQKWQMRIEFLARRRPARSSWGRRSRNKMFWQLSRGRGRALSFQFRISNGDPSSILISGTFMALMVTESRFYKPLGISSNYRLIFPKVIYYRTPYLWCKTRPSGPAIFGVEDSPCPRTSPPGPDFRVVVIIMILGNFLGQWFKDFPRILAGILRGGGGVW